MSTQRQNTQLELAFSSRARVETANRPEQGSEVPTAEQCTKSLAISNQLMEEIIERDNLKKALKRVQSNKGAPGTDGMTVAALPDFLREHWPSIQAQLLEGTYRPQPVKRVEIPKPNGGTRKLGIPTVVDRWIQQAILQIEQGQPVTGALKIIKTSPTQMLLAGSGHSENRYRPGNQLVTYNGVDSDGSPIQETWGGGVADIVEGSVILRWQHLYLNQGGSLAG